MKIKLHLLLLLFAIQVSAQQGGMWVPSLLNGFNEKEMKSLGMKMSISDIYDMNNSSLKDAIAHFGGGCTSEVISKEGLLLTNHHCGFGEIQQHSSIENDYLQDGFWAMTRDEELSNPDLEVSFIKRIEDVTADVMKGTEGMADSKTKSEIISKNMESLRNSFSKEEWQTIEIKSFFEGNQYILFVKETFKDVRLVGAPPSSIGKFGSDTDNWVWPRHTGDFALFRIYADKNNRPAEYSTDNVPYQPKHHLPISLGGVQENDFTLIFGFPGRTNEYLPAVAIDQTANVLNPVKIEIREQALKIVDNFMRNDRNIKLKYASKYASIANYWKKWIGESQGIEKSDAINARKQFEKQFLQRVNENPELADYKNLLHDFNLLYADIQNVSIARDYWIEVAYWNVELLNISFNIYRLENAAKNGEEAFEKARANTLKQFEGKYKNYLAKVDRPVFEKLLELYVTKIPKKYLNAELEGVNYKALSDKIYAQSALVSHESVKELLSGTSKEVIAKINQDPGYQLGKILSKQYFEVINPDYRALKKQISNKQKQYMKALMTAFPDKQFFPDANSTLRVAYGQVKGYSPRDPIYYQPVTHLSGVMEKYVPGDYEFDVPKKLQKLYKEKDYGVYGYDGKMPVCFIGTNHTTGGNSGSPAIDANGNLIGLNFDRVWEGTMSDMNFDPEICRNIMVDIRYVMFIIDKYAGATHLVKEMDLVNVPQ
ncbi:S46 family peptidase [Aureivirga sp. CE67]|uniref:S46 family peptidase n=1 Tax=Aureivirga sp. CE67 TaxID=1788983 RepID=UPI0018C974A7|nr:S46 family peptidase [Aureivirga sp. CE67]